MNRWFRNILIAAGVLLVLVLAAPLLVPASAWRGQMEAALSRAMGRPVHIHGAMTLTVFPDLGIRAEKVTLANRPGAHAAHLAEIGALHITAQLWPLFRGRIEISDVTMEKPVIHLQVDRNGTANWELEGARAHAGTSAFGWQRTSIAQVTIKNGRVYYDNAHWRTHAAIENLDATLVWLGHALTFDGTLQQGSQQIAFDAKMPAPGALLTGKSTPVDLSITSDLLQASFKGAMMLNGPAVGRLKLDSPSLRKLAAWRGHPLPPGNGLEPLSVEARLHLDGDTAALSSLTLLLDKTTMRGNVVIDAQQSVPVVHGTLSLDHADLDSYFTPVRARPAHDNAGWSTQPFNFALLKRIDADLHLQSGPLTVEGLKIDKADFALALKDGLLNVRFAALSLYGGSGTAELRIDASKTVPVFRERAALHSIAAKPFLHDALDVDGIEGPADFTLDAAAWGSTVAQVMSTISGSGSLSIAHGRLLGADLEAMGRMIHFTHHSPAANPAATTPFDVMTTHFAIQRGLAATGDLRLSNAVADIKGMGVADLGRRRADLSIHPRVRLAMDERPRNDIADFTVPYHIGGRWDALSYAAETAPSKPNR